MVVEMWRHFRKVDPPPNGTEIAKIAERFWVLAGGGASATEGEPLAIWRRRLKQAMKGTANPRINEVLEVIRAKTQECLEIEGRSLRAHLPLELQEKIEAIVAD